MMFVDIGIDILLNLCIKVCIFITSTTKHFRGIMLYCKIDSNWAYSHA